MSMTAQHDFDEIVLYCRPHNHAGSCRPVMENQIAIFYP
jgi:hypothetical protein